MKIKTLILSLVITLGMFISISAQGTQSSKTMHSLQTSIPDPAINTVRYHTAFGIRAGGTSGLTVKHFISKKNALEGILGAWKNGFSATLLIEKYFSAFAIRGLNWYYGAGGHASMQTEAKINYINESPFRYKEIKDIGLGVDGIVGLEYKISPIPFALSIDLKPTIEITTRGAFWTSIDPGLGIKFTF